MMITRQDTVGKHLAEAFALLARNDSMCSRLALILIDNAAELILHEYITDRVYNLQPERDGARRDPLLSRDERIELIGSLPRRLMVLRDVWQVLNEEEAQVFQTAHALREESYHLGAIRTSIYSFLSWFYLTALAAFASRIGDPVLSSLGEKFVADHSTAQYDAASCSEYLAADLESRIEAALKAARAIASEEYANATDAELDRFFQGSEAQYGVRFAEEFRAKLKTDRLLDETLVPETDDPTLSFSVFGRWVEEAQALRDPIGCPRALRKWYAIDRKLIIYERILEYGRL